MLDHDLTLKNNELCLVGRTSAPDEPNVAGLYVRDTRFLSQCEFTFDGVSLSYLEFQSPTPDRLIITATNPTLRQAGTMIPAQSILFRIDTRLSTTLSLDITVENFGRNTVSGDFDTDIAADFRDMFDVRGMTPKERPALRPPTVSGMHVALTATASDDTSVTTRVAAPDVNEITPHTSEHDAAGVTLRHRTTLEPGETQSLAITIAPDPPGQPLADVSTFPGTSGFQPKLSVNSPSVPFNAFLSRCDADLALLQTTFPNGNIPAAGIPWYIAPFGRDSLVVALQSMPYYPVRTANTLRLLASLQGAAYDDFREEQPGKIPHEMRYGEMARTGQAPHSPYYGSIDSTPLFIMAFAQYDQWHRDRALYNDLVDNVRHALEWIESDGDMDGDGLLEYPGTQIDDTHISQQGWKDSGDSLNDADGRPAKGPIALIEVQGYVYAAYAWLAEAARRHNDTTWARELEAKAGNIRDKVEASYWMPDQQFYAQALDGEKRQVDAISSNPGHLLFCGLPRQDRADAVARRLAAADMNAGWGIRTLSRKMATYNPMSYHNGSIWPHDTSLAMAGLRAYGHIDLARTFAMSLVALAAKDPRHRIAELYCGFPGTHDGLGPVRYPVSCIPQAWAAGSGLLALTTLLGADITSSTADLSIAPHLPGNWEMLDVSGIRIGNRTFEVSIRSAGTGWTTEIRKQ